MLNYFALRYKTTAANMYHFFLWNVQNVRLFKSQTQLSKEINTFLISISVFFHGHWQRTAKQGKGEDHFLFHSNTSTCSQTFRHLFATLHVRWLSHIFNCTAGFVRLLLDELCHFIELPQFSSVAIVRIPFLGSRPHGCLDLPYGRNRFSFIRTIQKSLKILITKGA